MLRAQALELTTDDYVYLLPDYLPTVNQSLPWIDYSSSSDGMNALAKKAFEKALIVSGHRFLFAIVTSIFTLEMKSVDR